MAAIAVTELQTKRPCFPAMESSGIIDDDDSYGDNNDNNNGDDEC